jgi:hypothetical protein
MNRDPHRALIVALAGKLGPIDDLVSETRDWASATFTGMRHELRFSLPWTREAVIAAINLSEADMPMDDHFVADLRVIQCERQGERLMIELEALTIEEV